MWTVKFRLLYTTDWSKLYEKKSRRAPLGTGKMYIVLCKCTLHTLYIIHYLCILIQLPMLCNLSCWSWFAGKTYAALLPLQILFVFCTIAYRAAVTTFCMRWWGARIRNFNCVVWSKRITRFSSFAVNNWEKSQILVLTSSSHDL
jgi:hypothetical protein